MNAPTQAAHLQAVPQGTTPPPSNGYTAPTRRNGPSRSLAEVIVQLGFASRGDVEAAVAAARSSGQAAGRALLEATTISADQLARAVAERHGLDYVDLAIARTDMGAANLISPSAAKRYEAVPIAFTEDRTLIVAMADPANVIALDDIAIMTGLEVRPVVASREDVAVLISRLNKLDDAVQEAVLEDELEAGVDLADVRESAEDAPVIKLVHSIIAQAVEQGASDIHYEPGPREMTVRFRVDGVLSASTTVPRRMVPGVVSRIKIMADLDISERRVPQDGRCGMTIEGRRVDIRVATLPLVFGESVVMRILDKDGAVIDLDKLGMLKPERERFTKAFSQAHGAVLVTGPTGSGKSTSLYGALTVLNSPEKNIITIEDPVEYQIEGIKQMQINPKAGLTFAGGLRSMMRADPDIIMVGEIRDPETAHIAIEAALTGHLVLSTLHTNDAPGAITRLIEMGIEPFLVASAIDCVVAQRLARTLCSSCKKQVPVPASVLQDNGFDHATDIVACEPVGCVRCGGSGYKGRVGIYEVMTMTEEIRALALERQPADAFAAAAVRNGMRRLREEGLEKVMMGLTSLAEVARVTGTG